LASSRLPVIRSAIRATDPGNIEALLGTAFVDYTRCIAFLADNRAALLAAAEGAASATAQGRTPALSGSELICSITLAA
jgi:hypothetical protein